MSDVENNRSEAEELLPWYVNDSLSPAEREAVETAVQQDPQLARELEFLREVQATVQHRPDQPTPGEFGLARLKRDMAGTAPVREMPAARSDRVEQTSAGTIPWRGWRPLAIAACLMVAVLIGIRGIGPSEGPALVETPGVTITFKAGATEAQIRTLLLEVGASIEAGPSALGVYRLSLPADESKRQAVITRLRAATEIVESVGG